MNPVQSVLITGASSGIGEACALLLAERGWRVFAGVRKTKDARRLAAVSPNIIPLNLDITKSKRIAIVLTRIKKKVGKKGLQGLVNNAGVAIAGPIEFLPIEELRRQHEINFTAQVAVTQACLPLLRAGRGRVVNMSSISGRVTSPFLIPYSSSKFALEAFSDGLRRELRPWKLHVASIEPGAIATPIWMKSLSNALGTRTKMPQQAEALYGPNMQRMVDAAQRVGTHGEPAEVVARDVLHALSARRPRTRYTPGRLTAPAIWVLRHLPDAVIDWLLTRKS
jgi:NAD(P)-dependent dehydrogenase (short-subunit alcohol dehydrogenase family)